MDFKSKYKSLTLLITLLLSYSRLTKGDLLDSPCTADYECPNFPYTSCETHSEGVLSGCNIIEGFKIDSSSQKIYFLSRCDQGQNFTLLPYPKGDPGRVGLYSVNLNGSSLQEITSISETTGTPQYSIADSFVGLSPDDFFIIKIQRDGAILYSVDRVDFTLNEISLGNSTPNALDFDFSTNETFACLNGEVVSYQDISIDSLYSTVYNSTELPSGFFCENVIVRDDDLFISGTVQFGKLILQGSKDGLSLIQIILSVESILSFDVASSTLYYTNFTGLFSLSLLDNTTNTLATEGSPYISTQFYQDTVYYQSLSTIYRLDLGLQQSVDIFASSSNSSTCQCREGFSGLDCTQCSGSLQWYQGNPTCVPVSPDTGFPSYCSSSYQCGNVPFTICQENSCACASGFSGSLCGNCTGFVEWDNGTPSCVAVNQNGFPTFCSQDWECGNVPFTVCNDQQCACLEGFGGENCQSCNGTVEWSNGTPSCSS